MKKCDSTTTVLDGRRYGCNHPKGHAGPHENCVEPGWSGFSWTDAATTEPAPDRVVHRDVKPENVPEPAPVQPGLPGID